MRGHRRSFRCAAPVQLINCRHYPFGLRRKAARNVRSGGKSGASNGGPGASFIRCTPPRHGFLRQRRRIASRSSGDALIVERPGNDLAPVAPCEADDAAVAMGALSRFDPTLCSRFSASGARRAPPFVVTRGFSVFRFGRLVSFTRHLVMASSGGNQRRLVGEIDCLANSVSSLHHRGRSIVMRLHHAPATRCVMCCQIGSCSKRPLSVCQIVLE